MSDAIPRLNAALEGRYRIERELGAGGMATVYLADDVRHQRKVAIKVLKPELAAVIGADRFLAEIRTTANLQHPHILPLFDSGEADGFLYFVMPYVEGESLRDRIDREKQLPLDDAVRLAKEVADALAYAHGRGVVHRDVKPANILLHDGRALVADFGIALAVSAAGGARLTETGLSLGTPYYMSPEQATADRELDGRSDVYSLGCITYEMVAGEPPHTGSTAQAVITKILTDEPRPLHELRSSVADNVAAAVSQSLRKVPADRFAGANAFADALSDPDFRVLSGPASRAGTAADGGRWKGLAVTATTVAVVAGAAAVFGWLRPTAAPEAVREWSVALPELSRISSVVLSPVGERIVFVGDGELWVRSLRDRTARPLPGTEGAVSPFWSPDAEWIGFMVGRRVLKVTYDGGAPVPVTSLDLACVDSFACSGSWTTDGRIFLSTGYSGVYQVSEDGGDVSVLIESTETEHFHRVVALPDGEGALLDVDPADGEASIAVWDGVRTSLFADGTDGWFTTPAYDPAGFVLFNRAGLWAVPFSAETVESTGEPFIVRSDATFPSVSNDGMLLFRARTPRISRAVWVDRTGTVRDTVGSVQGRASFPAVAPDGRRVAFQAGEEVWIVDPTRGQRVPLATGDIESAPVWSDDGVGLYVGTVPRHVDDAQALIRYSRPGGVLARDIASSASLPSVSRDGRYMAFQLGDVGEVDIHFVDLGDPAGAPRPFAATADHEANPQLSPDGRHIAYVYGGYDDGRFEIFLSAFPGGGERHQVSAGGISYAAQIRWSPDGDRLYYERSADGALMEVDVDLATDVTLSSPRELFREADIALTDGFDVTADGSRFVVIQRQVPYGGDPGGIVVMENWRAAFGEATEGR